MTGVGTVPETDDVAGYYGKPIVRAHIWKDSIGWYFFTGGLAGASSVLAAVADLAGRPALAGHAHRAAMIGLLPSPALLVADLGRPARFHHMLRVFKPTSPMSVGSWLLLAYSPMAGGAWILGELNRWSRVGRAMGTAAGVLGSLVSTYTAVLVADTATPAWHEARRELPFVFASSAAASAGAVTGIVATCSGVEREPLATRVGVVGAIAEVVSTEVMRRRLGELDVTETDPATRRFHRAARVLSIGGAALAVASRFVPDRPRSLRTTTALIGRLAIVAGSVCTRMSVVRAGTASASDPAGVIVQQRGPSARSSDTG